MVSEDGEAAVLRPEARRHPINRRQGGDVVSLVIYKIAGEQQQIGIRSLDPLQQAVMAINSDEEWERVCRSRTAFGFHPHGFSAH